MHWLRTLPITLLVSSLACQPTQEELANGDDPIAALSSTVESSRYGPKYWSEQMTADSETWTKALEYCAPAEHANYPNCEVVASVKFAEAPGPVDNPFQSEKGLNP